MGQTRASASIQHSNNRHRGRASTAGTTSHSEYCGDHTLLNSKNATRISKTSSATRGTRRAVTPSAKIPAQQARKAPKENALTAVMGGWRPNVRSSTA